MKIAENVQIWRNLLRDPKAQKELMFSDDADNNYDDDDDDDDLTS
jgi:hypothetical protein